MLADHIVRRILVLARRDWLHSAASHFEHYLREVFTRIAAEGHYVALVAGADWPLLRPHKPRESVERIDDVLLARLGLGPVGRVMKRMMLTKLGAQREPSFDVAVDCVDGRPFPFPPKWNLPVAPLVHRLKGPGEQLTETEGPVIATNNAALDALTRRGIAEKRIVRAPHGYPAAPHDAVPLPGGEGVAVLSKRRRRVVSYARMLGSVGGAGAPRVTNVRCAGKEPGELCEAGSEALNGHAVAVCERGCEHLARQAAVRGAVPVCPPTSAGALYTEDGETGVLAEGARPRDLAAAAAGLVEDPARRAALQAEARKRGEEWPWEKTAALVLATIENLGSPQAPRPQSP